MRLSLVWSAVLASVLSGAACADDLMDVYGVALVKDPVVLQIKAQRDATREAINEVDAAMLPQINLSGDAHYQKTNRNDTGTAFVGLPESDS